jgi:hypothetical protein
MLDENDPWLDRVTDADVVDPLSGIARKERTTLMVANLLMFAVFQMQLVPTKIDFLGIETNKISTSAVMVGCVLAVVFFGFSFLLTTRSEHRAWRSRLESLRERRELRGRFYLDKRLDRMRDWIDTDVSTLAASKDEPLTASQKQDLVAARIAIFNKESNVAWNEYKTGYETRFFVDVKLPLIVTAINLAASAVTFYLHPSMLHGAP